MFSLITNETYFIMKSVDIRQNMFILSMIETTSPQHAKHGGRGWKGREWPKDPNLELQ